MTTTTNQYLALYTGPGGPISAEFAADDLEEAAAHVAAHRSEWFDEASDVLDVLKLPEGADDDTIADALDAEGWTLALRAGHDGDYSLFMIG